MGIPHCQDMVARIESTGDSSSIGSIDSPPYLLASLDGYYYTFMPELEAPAMCNVEARRIIYNFAHWPKYLHKYGFFSSSFDEDITGLGRFMALIDLHEMTHLAEPFACHTRDIRGASDDDSWVKILLPLVAKDEPVR